MADSYEITRARVFLLITINIILFALFLILGITIGRNMDPSPVPSQLNPDEFRYSEQPENTAPPAKKQPVVPDAGHRKPAVETKRQNQPVPTPPGKKESGKTYRSAGTGEVYVIQVTSVGDKRRAVALKRKLDAHGFNAFISEIRFANRRKHYRVRVGPFPDRSSAEKTEKQIRSLGLETLLMKVNGKQVP